MAVGDPYNPRMPPPWLGAGDAGAWPRPAQKAPKGGGSGNRLWKNSRWPQAFQREAVALEHGPNGRPRCSARALGKDGGQPPSCERHPCGWTHRATVASLGSGQNHIFRDYEEIVGVSPEKEAWASVGAFQGLRRVPEGLCRRAEAAAWWDLGVHGARARSGGSCFSRFAQGARVSQGRSLSCCRGFAGEEGAGGQTHCMLGSGLRHRVRFRSLSRFPTMSRVQKWGHCLRANSWALLTLVAAQSPPWAVGGPNPPGAAGTDGTGSMETGVQASPRCAGGPGGGGAAGGWGAEAPCARCALPPRCVPLPARPSHARSRRRAPGRSTSQCQPPVSCGGSCRREPERRGGAPHGAFPSAFLPWDACFSSVVFGHQIFLLSACAPFSTFQSHVTVPEELSAHEYPGRRWVLDLRVPGGGSWRTVRGTGAARRFDVLWRLPGGRGFLTLPGIFAETQKDECSGLF